jgi:hypothetical protein
VLYILGVSDFVRRDPEGNVVLDTESQRRTHPLARRCGATFSHPTRWRA